MLYLVTGVRVVSSHSCACLSVPPCVSRVLRPPHVGVAGLRSGRGRLLS